MKQDTNTKTIADVLFGAPVMDYAKITMHMPIGEVNPTVALVFHIEVVGEDDQGLTVNLFRVGTVKFDSDEFNELPYIEKIFYCMEVAYDALGFCPPEVGHCIAIDRHDTCDVCIETRFVISNFDAEPSDSQQDDIVDFIEREQDSVLLIYGSDDVECITPG